MRPLDLSPLFFAVLQVFIVPALTGCKNSGVDAFKERESVRRCESRDMGPGVRHVGYYPRDSRKCQATIDDNCYKCRILQDTPPDKYNENGEKVAYTSRCKDNCCNLHLDEQGGCPPGRGLGLIEYVCIYWEKRGEDWSWYCYIVEVSCRKDGKGLDYFENHKRHLTVDQDNKPEVYFPEKTIDSIPVPKWQDYTPPCRLVKTLVWHSFFQLCDGRDYYIWDMNDGKVTVGTTTTTTTTIATTSTTTATPTATKTTPATTTTKFTSYNYDDNSIYDNDHGYANYHQDNASDYDYEVYFFNYDDNSVFDNDHRYSDDEHYHFFNDDDSVEHSDHYYPNDDGDDYDPSRDYHHFLNDDYDSVEYSHHYYPNDDGDDDYSSRDYHHFLNDREDNSVYDDYHHSSDRVDYHTNYAHNYNDNRDEHHHACNDLNQHRFVSH